MILLAVVLEITLKTIKSVQFENTVIQKLEIGCGLENMIKKQTNL